MREIWSETHKRILWRKVWVALAQVESEFGLVTPEQLQDLIDHQNQVDVQKSLEVEKEVQHDLMAELRTFANQAHIGGGSLHLGATSTDIEDNTDALRIRESMEIVLDELRELVLLMADRTEAWAELPVIGFTHLQPAEPTTLGYRLAFTTQDIFNGWVTLRGIQIRGKGFKGAVGTAAAYTQLIGQSRFEEFEIRLCQLLELPFFPVTGQTSPRMQEYWVISALAGLAAPLNKLAFDLRILQSPVIGELSEPFGKQQVGSSAMPFKRNPVTSEKIDSIARWIAQLPRLAWDNAALSLLERTLDDSANRRSLLPEAFLAIDELVHSAIRIVKGISIDETAMQRNLQEYGIFAALEPVLMELTRAGADRQSMHAILRNHAMKAWEATRQGEQNPLARLVANDEKLFPYLSSNQLLELMTNLNHLGIAPERAREMAALVRKSLAAQV
jgi:adenylosuccinate lyase